MPPGATVIVKTQKVVVNPQTRQVAVINAGPQGPQGAPGPGGNNDYIRADGTVPMLADLILPGGGKALSDNGDRMTGPLEIVSSVEQLRLARSGATTPHMGFYDELFGTRYGYIMGSNGQLRIVQQGAGGSVGLMANGIEQVRLTESQLQVLSAASPAVPVSLNFVGNRTYQMLNLYGTSYAIGVQGSAMYFRTGGTAQDFAWFQGGVHSDTNEDAGAGGRCAMVLRPDGLYLPDVNVTNLVVGASASSGARIRLHVPTTGDIVYFDFAGNGAAGTESIYFRAGTVSVLQLEDTVIRPLKPFYAQGIRMGSASAIWGAGGATTPSAYLALYGVATDVNTVGTRSGYLGFAGSTNFNIINEIADAPLRLITDGVLTVLTAGAERIRVDTAGVLNVGRTSNAAYYTDAGADFRNSGQFLCTYDTVNSYPWLIRIGAALAAGQRFLSFRTAVSGTGSEIGSISMPTTTTTAYNTTSHGPFKGNVEDLDDDAAIERILKWRPVSFQWKLDENGQASEEGIPQGEVQHGFIAQEINEIQPDAVTPGRGTWAEELEWREKHKAWAEASKAHAEWMIAQDGEEVVLDEPEVPEDPGESPFTPWMGDWSFLVPDISAAMQALIRRNEALSARVEELERRLG